MDRQEGEDDCVPDRARVGGTGVESPREGGRNRKSTFLCRQGVTLQKNPLSHTKQKIKLIYNCLITYKNIPCYAKILKTYIPPY